MERQNFLIAYNRTTQYVSMYTDESESILYKRLCHSQQSSYSYCTSWCFHLSCVTTLLDMLLSFCACIVVLLVHPVFIVSFKYTYMYRIHGLQNNQIYRSTIVFFFDSFRIFLFIIAKILIYCFFFVHQMSHFCLQNRRQS